MILVAQTFYVRSILSIPMTDGQYRPIFTYMLHLRSWCELFYTLSK